MSTGVREPIAAGSLYASDSHDLRVEIDNAIKTADSEFTSPKVLILPDCGLSAAPTIAGAALVMLEAERGQIDRVIIIGDHNPSLGDRRVAGIVAARSVAFRTPLGDLLLDPVSMQTLADHPSVVVNDRPFRTDSSIEVQLPALQRLLGAVRIVPLLVGEATTDEVLDVLERIWGEKETLVIVPAAFARGTSYEEVSDRGDKVRTQAIKCEVSALAQSGASSPRSLAAIASICARRSMGVLELGSDLTDDPLFEGGFVDYGAVAAWESFEVELPESDVDHLRRLAAGTVQLTVLGARVTGTDHGRVPPALTVRRPSVVTLRRDGEVRGSAGVIEADRTLAASVVRNAAAACADPRLPSIQPHELGDLSMTISIVSPIERIFPHAWVDLTSMLARGRHGVLIIGNGSRSAQLPAMWGNDTSHDHFISKLIGRLGLTLSDSVTAAAWYRFETFDY